MNENTLFDYIVVGAGAAGCVVASRLSEDPDVSVCLLEAGGPDTHVLVHMPAGVAAMVPTSINNWQYQTVPQAGLNGRIGYQPRGKTLGGSSSINAMAYHRGHPEDFNRWAALGNHGWAIRTYCRSSSAPSTTNTSRMNCTGRTARSTCASTPRPIHLAKPSSKPAYRRATRPVPIRTARAWKVSVVCR